MEEPPEKRFQLDSLTDELLVEIFCRLPVRSLCRFKCVSRKWRYLIRDRDHRKKLPHSLVGFFYGSCNTERFPMWAHHFTNVTGRGRTFIYPSFSFLPFCSSDVYLLDCCNGLLLCRCYQPGPRDSNGNRPFHYVVCNPATEKWVMLPDRSCASDECRTACLGFDPAISSHFHVIEYVVDEAACEVIGVEIYSSKTASWRFKESEWGDHVMVSYESRNVFINGFMHMLTCTWEIIAVDMEGKTWRTIPAPPGVDDGCILDDGCIHQAQGRLCLLHCELSKLSIWILEDYGTHEWTLKHTVTTLQLFRQKSIPFGMYAGYNVITVHPECNLIFFVFGRDQTLMAYEMDRKEVRVIRKLGRECSGPYIPYVPLFLESLAEQ